MEILIASNLLKSIEPDCDNYCACDCDNYCSCDKEYYSKTYCDGDCSIDDCTCDVDCRYDDCMMGA